MPAETADGREWDAALKDLDDATSISAEFFDVTFDEESFNRALGLALQTGGASTGSVAVLLDGCSLEGQKFDAAAVSEVPGSRQWTITLKDSKITSNTLNMTGAVAVQDAADVTLKILSSSACLACSPWQLAAALVALLQRPPTSSPCCPAAPLPPLQPSPTTGWACWAPPRWAPPAAPASRLPSAAW